MKDFFFFLNLTFILFERRETNNRDLALLTSPPNCLKQPGLGQVETSSQKFRSDLLHRQQGPELSPAPSKGTH